jgi:hypothetical protein
MTWVVIVYDNGNLIDIHTIITTKKTNKKYIYISYKDFFGQQQENEKKLRIKRRKF